MQALKEWQQRMHQAQLEGERQQGEELRGAQAALGAMAQYQQEAVRVSGDRLALRSHGRGCEWPFKPAVVRSQVIS